MTNIIPTIQENNVLVFDEKLISISEIVDRIHIDVVDGAFIDNRSLQPEEWPELPPNLKIDIHLMVNEPENWILKLKDKNPNLIIGQFEAIKDLEKFVFNAKNYEIKAGIALDIETPIDVVTEDLLPELSSILLMAYKTGFSGQELDERVYAKIKNLRQLVGKSTEIIVDGGINLETGQKCIEAGVDSLAVNTFLWENPEENLRKLSSLK
jgi:ribulose-phosphate 3-epimerase